MYNNFIKAIFLLMFFQKKILIISFMYIFYGKLAAFYPILFISDKKIKHVVVFLSMFSEAKRIGRRGTTQRVIPIQGELPSRSITKYNKPMGLLGYCWRYFVSIVICPAITAQSIRSGSTNTVCDTKRNSSKASR